jgi:hypothetical protein
VWPLDADRGVVSWRLSTRPSIPRPLVRQVLIEAGHRCAIPTCRSIPVEIAHIKPWSDVREHSFDNLLALCPNCHARHHRGEIDRQSLIAYKALLASVLSRYNDLEQRLLFVFARMPKGSGYVFVTDRSYDFEFMYLLADCLLVEDEEMAASAARGTSRTDLRVYRLTELGREVMANIPEAHAHTGAEDGVVE